MFLSSTFKVATSSEVVAPWTVRSPSITISSSKVLEPGILPARAKVNVASPELKLAPPVSPPCVLVVIFTAVISLLHLLSTTAPFQYKVPPTL